MAPDEPLEIALSQALARYTPRVDFPLPVETESGAGRRPKRKADSLPYMPMRDLPQLRKLLSTEAASLLETAQESQEELGEAILARLRTGRGPRALLWLAVDQSLPFGF